MRKNFKWTEAEISDVIAYRVNGLTYAEIADMFGVTRQAIHSMLYDRKIPKVHAPLPRRTDLEKLLRRKFSRKKCWAKRNNIVFDLVFDEVEWPEFCPVLGVKLEYTLSDDFDYANCASFDRVDNSKGYVRGNVVIISKRANVIKNDSSLVELKALVNFLESHVFC